MVFHAQRHSIDHRVEEASVQPTPKYPGRCPTFKIEEPVVVHYVASLWAAECDWYSISGLHLSLPLLIEFPLSCPCLSSLASRTVSGAKYYYEIRNKEKTNYFHHNLFKLLPVVLERL